jgi:TonB-linked SusC/RagA family outer membrane protein
LATPNNAYPIKNPDGSWGGTNSFQTNLQSSMLNSGYILDNAKDVMANIVLAYDMGKWMKGLSAKFRTNLSIQSLNSTVRNKQSLTYKYGIGPDGDTTYSKFGTPQSQSNNFVTVFNARYWFAQASLNYDRNFGDHGVSAALLADQQQTTFNYDLPGKLNNLSAKAAYNYKEKYFLEGAINYSGYNRYMPGRQYGLFYAGGIGWDIAKEDFFKENVSWINLLKLRATYGKTGNGVDNSGYYIWRPSFALNNGVGGGIYSQGTTRSPGQGFEEYNGALSNINISWEKAHKLNTGIDISLWQDRLQVTASYYHDKYYDLLQLRGKSIALIGLSYPPENIGVNLYTGQELTVTYQDHIGNFNYFITGNISREQTKVLFVDEQKRRYEWNKRTGQPVGMPFGYIADGFFQTAEEAANGATIAGYTPKPGDIKYKDLNGDGLIDQFDEAPIGTDKPRVYYGATVGFNYKGFEVSALVQGVTNRLMEVNNFATEAGFLYYNGTYGQAYEQILHRWTPETAATATYPRLTALANTNNQQRSSFWMRSGNYVRLKNISIAYNLPASWMRPIRISGVRVFANAENLFTHAAYDWVDPEVGVGAYPIQRVFNAGINIKL